MPFFFFALLLAASWLAGSRFTVEEAWLRQPLSSLPLPAACAAFVVIYVSVTTLLWFSKDILRLGAAVVFGPALSALVVWAAEMANCLILFHFARSAGREFVEKNLPAAARGLYDRAGGTRTGWLLLLRCAPVFPFRLLDLGAGLSALPFRRYFLASLAGSPLRIFWLQLVLAGAGLAALKGPLALSGYLEAHPGMIAFSLLYFAFMAVVLLVLKRREHACRSR